MQPVPAFRCTYPVVAQVRSIAIYAAAGVDVTQDDAWEGVRQAVATRHIDVLILNAGILIKDDLADLSCQQDSLLEQVSGLWPSCLWCA